MKKKLLFCIFSVFFILSACSQIDFKTTPPHPDDISSAVADLPSMVYVSKANCITCIITEISTFQAAETAAFFSEKYHAFKLDYNDENAKKWIEKFDLCCLPAFLFFDDKGNFVQKIQAPLPTTALGGMLRNPSNYNSESEPSTPIPPGESAFDSETIVMEEISFSEEGETETTLSKPVSKEKPDFEELLVYSEPFDNQASVIQVKGEFLYKLKLHIAGLEDAYVTYTADETANVLSFLAKRDTSSTALPDFTSGNLSRGFPSGKLVENTEELYQLIQEYKDWVYRIEYASLEPSLPELPRELPKETLAPDSARLFRVQTGYFQNKNFADRMVTDLKRNYDEKIEIKSEEKNGVFFHRVLIGGFYDPDDAIVLYQKLRKDGRKAILKKI